jgi:hypothetical protein
MVRNSAVKVWLGLVLGLVGVTRLGAQAPVRDTASDTTGTAYDTTGTYLTLDGLGLGRIMPASISDVALRVRSALIGMKVVQERERSLGQGTREVRGKKGLSDVIVRFRSQSPSATRVEVTALRGPASADKGMEHELLDAIEKAK